jgi:6-phosphogluconolactonase/glucosamine-6-phosphate isomerase/deaminase
MGASKADVLAQVFDASVPLQQSLPSARIRQRAAGGAAGEPPTWFTDAAAAEKL